ncbi:TetR/AcrR family transcriptional regulator [Rhodococcus sp. KRD162]|uniref:TetR/AcrR family transcriptional regulator n=1 Tax=unclassified Rhodococcus (in: high G+C Gram-positive bacteria) TaxID=192944 RepID=UPI0019D0D047|nr:TetR family transcriptional regulator C-terminal domain-containing protein [Rhodococcus sp. KRD162]
MPRTPDHTARRTQIAEALVRAATRDGLHAVTMRSVAAEAGVSLRLVQYYFVSKEQLLVGALRHLERCSHERWAQRLADIPQPLPARSVIEAFVSEALPTDESSRVFHQLSMSYAVLAMTNPQIAEQPFISGVDRLESELIEVLEGALAANEIAPDRDAHTEAVRLVALVNGLGTGILIGHYTDEHAAEVVAYHLDRLFAPAQHERDEAVDAAYR